MLKRASNLVRGFIITIGSELLSSDVYAACKMGR